MPPLFAFQSQANIFGYEGTGKYNSLQFDPSKAITIGLNLSALKFCYF